MYIISGGLAEPVEEFGIHLGVPRERIRAVNISYNQLSGTWWQNNEKDGQERYLTFSEGALTVSDGKAQIVRELLGKQKGRSLLIGDGSSDLMAGKAVDLFVGFGGVVKRDRVFAEAPTFIHSPSLAPLVALAAGPAAIKRLQTTRHKVIMIKTLNLIKTGAITFQDEHLRTKFQRAYDAIF